MTPTMAAKGTLAAIILGLLGGALGESHDAMTSKYSNIRQREQRRLAGETVEVWCVASANASDVDLQNALDWACGPLANQGQANCGPINVGGACFDPDTTPAHSSYAFNEYFRRMNANLEACNFTMAATITTIDPSHGTCEYTGSYVPVNENLTSMIGALPPASAPAPVLQSPAPQSGTVGFEPSYLFCMSTVITLVTYMFT